MINPEITESANNNFALVLALLAMLVTLIVIAYLSRKSHAREKRIRQDYETLALAKQLKCNTQDDEHLKAMGLPPLHVKSDSEAAIESEVRAVVIFVIVILAGYFSLAFYFYQNQFSAVTIGAAVFAILSSVFLVLSLKKLKQGKQALKQLQQQVEAHENSLSHSATQTTTETSEVHVPTAGIDPRYHKPLAQLYELAKQFKHSVPEDSLLKRHFMTQLLAETEALLPTRPTDATLKRHYAQLLQNKLIERLEQYAKQAKEPVGVTQAIVVEKALIPEDSTLRRHFLTELRFKIEQRLGMPRPTDFNLRRHYETLVQKLLEQELEEHYQ